MYTKINWKDAPSTDTPINATNLNKMDNAIADLDGAKVVANPTLAGSEDELESVQIGSTKYKLGGASVASDVTMTATSIITATNVQGAFNYISGSDSTDIATITTVSTGGTSASIKVVHPAKSVDETIGYRSVLDTYKDYYFFAIKYNSSITSWQIKALKPLKYNGTVYSAGDIVTSFLYSAQANISLYNMENAKPLFVINETGKSLVSDSEITRLASVHNYDDTAIRNEVSTKISSIPCTDYSSIDAPTYIDIDERIDKLNEDLSYKEGVKLVPADFETVLGYYSKNTFHEGQKSWMCRLLRVSVNEGEKYKYYTYTDNIYVINYLDSDLNVVKQDTATTNVELEIDVVVPSGVSYIDFYTANFYYKSYVLKYDTSESLYKEEGNIYIDATSDFTVTDGKFFIPNRTSYVDGYKMVLKSVTPSEDTLYRFSFCQHQVYSAYVDDCCIAPHITYVDGTEVFRENIVVYVPQGKTLRINDYDSSTYTSKIEKLVGLTEQVILELISKMM